ncbi:MAG TPA: response regulator transcription factor [Terriglobales bacterium]|nr:response regulator transcription factor [Terriglobales bacterium]
MPKIRLLIASEHPIVRTGLGKLLNGTQDFEVIAVVDLSDIVKAGLELSPDVFLVELTDVGLAGLQATAALMRAITTAAVAVLSSNENPSYVRSLLAMGVRAYVARSASNSELYAALRTVYCGRRYLDPRLSDSITDMLVGRKTAAIRNPQVKRLSGREAQVLRGVARGFTTKAIAVKLGVSDRTIQTYRERIYEKLELRTRADLVHYAIAHGMLNSTESTS